MAVRIDLTAMMWRLRSTSRGEMLRLEVYCAPGREREVAAELEGAYVHARGSVRVAGAHDVAAAVAALDGDTELATAVAAWCTTASNARRSAVSSARREERRAAVRRCLYLAGE